MLTSLDGISLNVGWIGDDLSGILFTSEVLLDVGIVRFMLVSCTIVSLLDSALRLEPLFITASDLNVSMFEPLNLPDGRLEAIAEAVVCRFVEKHLVDGRAVFDGVGPNIRRVDLNLLQLRVGDEPRYSQRKTTVMRLVKYT